MERVYGAPRVSLQTLIYEHSLTPVKYFYKFVSMMVDESAKNCDLNDVILEEVRKPEAELNDKGKKRLKRVLQFSDGVLEEYSSEDDVDSPKEILTKPQIDPKTLTWLPWAWYQTTWVGEKVLEGCDYMGECLASFFGITSPKYQFEINEYYRLQANKEEMIRKNDLEMGGWNDRKKSNLIGDSTVMTKDTR